VANTSYVAVAPRKEIRRWIHHFWVFESERALPANDLRVEVPNGRPKLIVPFRNGLTASATSICGSITRRVTLS
jgi:hypothetical protein